MRSIRSIRTGLNMTMRQASDLSGVRIASWSDVETGKTPNPGIRTCRAMADALCLSLDEFYDCSEFRIDTANR